MNSKPENFEGLFISWLTTKIKPANMYEIRDALRVINAYCLEKRIITQSLFESIDILTVKKVRMMVEGNKFFRFIHKKKFTKCIEAIRYYDSFIKKYIDSIKNHNNVTNATLVTINEENKEFSIDSSNRTITNKIYSSKEENDSVVTVNSQAEKSSNNEIEYNKMCGIRKNKSYSFGKKYESITNEKFNNESNSDDYSIQKIMIDHSMKLPLEEKIRRVLKKECQKNQFGTTTLFISSQIPNINTYEVEQTLKEVPWAKFSYGRWTYDESEDSIVYLPENINIKSIDFNNFETFAFTKPVSFSYFGEEQNNIRSWKELYVKLFTKIYADYPHIFSIGQSFTNREKSKLDLGDSFSCLGMRAPKEIIVDGKTFYLETNLSASDIVNKIKYILDLCNVDYENIIINYYCTTPSRKQHTNSHVASVPQNKRETTDIAVFLEWMIDNGYSLSTIRKYSSAITWSHHFALEHNFEHCKLIGESTQQCILAAKELLNNAEYLAYNEQQHDCFGSAIVKYLEFKGVKTTYSELKETKNLAANKTEENPKKASIRDIENIDISPYEKVMKEMFVRGFRLDSKLDLKKFKRYFEALNSCEIDKNDKQIVEVLKSCCIEYDEKLFLPTMMLSIEVKEKLFMYINKCFCEGKTVIYYDALFSEFSESFLDYYIYNAHMLMLYLDYYCDNKFYVGSKYISKEASISVDLSSGIKEYLIAHGVPMDTEELCAVFSNVPKSEIRKALREDGFIFNGGEQYFYISMIVLTQADIEGISEIIQEYINKQEYITSNELLEIIKVRYPHIVENNTVYSNLGIRNTIGYHLQDKFSFNSVIISEKGKALYASDVFVNFAKSKDSFDLDELQSLSIEIDRSIYFEDIYDNCLRINETQFVSKKHQQFRIEETDIAIERFCTGNYIAIDEISEFGSFPDAGYQWNNFLLSNYVYGYSKKFKLITARLTKTGTAGAIVKRNCRIATMDDLLVDVLAKSQCVLQKKTALEYLVNKGYLSSRAYKSIGNVLIKAQAMRNRKE